MRYAAFVLVVVFLVAVSGAAWADTISPTSYDMENGSSAGYGYLDDTYTGSGDKTIGHAPLSGGLGDLTDGVIPTQSWYYVETSSADPEPYVGWMDRGVTITFHFGAVVNVESVTVHADHADYGAVYIPASIAIAMGGASSSSAVSVPSTYGPQALTYSNLGMTGTSLTLTIASRYSSGSTWIMLSEVAFDGSTAAVPEPTTLALFGLGAGALALRRRRRKLA